MYFGLTAVDAPSVGLVAAVATAVAAVADAAVAATEVPASAVTCGTVPFCSIPSSSSHELYEHVRFVVCVRNCVTALDYTKRIMR